MARPGTKPHPVVLSAQQREELRIRAAGLQRPYREVVRARIVLALAEDPSPSAVASRLGIDRKTVTRWRDRFLLWDIDGLRDRERSGRPPRIDPVSRCEVIAMACARPREHGVDRNTWTYTALCEAWQQLHPEQLIARSSVIRILLDADLRPHRMKMWCHSTDPLFREKTAEICDLYLNPPEGSVVVCVDEKTGIQALGRKFPISAPLPGRQGRIDNHYRRNGTRKLIAAFFPHTGEVYGEMRPTRTAADLVEFMEALAKRCPGVQVHVVWDNLNTHYDGKDERWTRFDARHGGRFHFHYTPIHASWLNQVELWFGILQRRVIKHGVHDSLEQLDDAVEHFIDHWNQHERHPFRWTFTGYPLQVGRSAA